MIFAVRRVGTHCRVDLIVGHESGPLDPCFDVARLTNNQAHPFDYGRRATTGINQLALAICMAVLDDAELALHVYEGFRDITLRRKRRGSWVLSGKQVRDVIGDVLRVPRKEDPPAKQHHHVGT